MDAELVARTRSMDPVVFGERIKARRLAAGLTQVQLAGDEISAAYVSRIEDGQRRPGPKLIEKLAERLGTSPDDLLLGVSREDRMELRVQLDFGELAMASGSADRALAAAETVLDRAATIGDRELERSARLLRATAREAVGDVRRAIEDLEVLAAAPRAETSWLKCLIALCRCYRDAGDLNKAIAVGADAAGEIARLGLQGMTEAIQLTVTVAYAHRIRGDLDLAMDACDAAIKAAETYDSPLARASAYWNASAVESDRGSHVLAHDLASKALALFELSDDSRNEARLRTDLAALKLQLDPPDALGALKAVDQAAAAMTAAPNTAHDRAGNHLVRGRALFILGRHDAALVEVEALEQNAPDLAPLRRAAAHVLRGEIALAAQRTDAGRAEFLEAIQVLSSIGADRGAAQLWMDLGALLSQVGEHIAASDAFRRGAACVGLTSRADNPVAVLA